MANHWFSSDHPYDYDYAPRVSHFFEDQAEWSYCGFLHRADTNRRRQPRRQCLVCIWYLVKDGVARVILPA
jgi:predicted hydrolase (HD superfamily)